MRGREIFLIFKPFFICATGVCRLFPFGFCRWLFSFFRYSRGKIGIGIRYVLLKRLTRNCGDNVSVHESVWLLWMQHLSLGSNVSIHPLCYIDAQGKVSIGDDVSIAHNVSILSFKHDFSDTTKPIKDAPCVPKEIVIENDVWFGAGARILGGVRIGTGSVIGAGAVVTKDLPPMSIAVGVPARVIKSRKLPGSTP